MSDGSGDKVGQQFGNYQLIRLLGQGGFAEVYLGEHTYLKAQAAIKVMRARLAKQDMESFLAEARTIARLRHPYIVGVLEFGVENGTPFLVMDYAPNGTLKQRHPRGTPLHATTIVPYIKQVAEALQYAHEQKLIHRDIKPENMLLGSNNEVLLSDFGIAVIAQSSRGLKHEVAGTVTYMAPEQLQGRPDPASDQYALAIVVYEWLTGDMPFHGGFVQVAAQHVLAPPPPLREQVPTIPPAVEQVVLTALAKEPQQRFSSVQAFADALEHAGQSGLSETIIPPPVPNPSPPSPTVSPLGAKTLPEAQALQPLSLSPTLPAEPQPRFGLFRKTTALLAVLALFIIAGGGFIYYAIATQPGQSHPQATLTVQQQQTALSSTYATATRQAESKATAQAQATTTALQTLYMQSISGSPVLDDPLNAQDQYQWDEFAPSPTRGSCMFQGGIYHVMSSLSQAFQECLASNAHFSNFAFQVQVTNITGDAAAVVFRATPINHAVEGYRFYISTSSEYRLELFPGAIGGRALQKGISPAIHTRQGQTNEITVIAKGSDIYIYVNQQFVTSVSDSTFSNGAIGVGAGDLTTSTEATFKNAKVWVL